MTEAPLEIDVDRRTFLASAGVLTGTVLAGCAGNSDQNTGGDDKIADAKKKGEKVRINVAIPHEIWNLDPAIWTDTASSIVGSLIYDEIVALDTDRHLQPELATEVPKPKMDGKAYDYTLRNGVKFHNGDPVTVEDLKYSVDWILNPENNAPIRGYLPFVESTEIVGDRTLRLKLSKSLGTLNWWMTRAIDGIVPKGSRGTSKKVKGPVGIATSLTNDPGGAGTGAFKFVEWKSGSHVLLKKFEDYWMEDVPKVDEIKFSFVPENASRIASIESGNADLTPKLPPKDFNRLKSQPDITAKSIPGNTTEILYTNLMDSGDNPMSNVHNRRAVMYAIDAQEIIDEVFYGQAVPQNGPWYLDSEWTSPKLKEMDLYDVDKARAELEKAGNPNGFTLNILATKGSWFKKEAVIIQNQLAQIGIDASVTTAEKATIFSQIYGTTDWHVAMEDWSQSIPVATYWLEAGFADNNHNHNNWHHPSPDLMDPYKPSGPPAPKGVRDKYSNGHEWFVAKLREAQSTQSTQKRKEIVWTLEEYLVENAIQINIAYKNRSAAWQNELKGFQMGTFTNDYRSLSKQ